MKTLKEQLASAKRELAYRNRVYPRWVKENRMPESKAKFEIECMESIIQTLEKANVLFEVSQEIMASWPKETEQQPSLLEAKPAAPASGEACAFCQTINAPGAVSCMSCGKPLYRALMEAAKRA